MELDNRTPYEVAWLPGRLRYPGRSLTFIVKATYDLVGGGVARVAEEQIGICGDEPLPGDHPDSLFYESDLAHFKPEADRLLVGRCHAPNGVPTVACQVAFTVGSWSRALHVVGNRTWKRQLLKASPSSPEPFTSMELSYENAFGGPDYAPNPVGKGFQRAGGASDDRVHNIEDPRQPVKSQSDRPVPAGFGPVSRTWWPRKQLIGTYGKTWFRTRCPWFPEDMDWKVANAAPIPSQAAGYLLGDETIELLNVHPTVPLFASRLPGVRVRCVVERWGARGAGRYEEPAMRLDTLWIDAENETLVLVWRGDCNVASEEFEDLKRLHVVAEPMDGASTREQLITTFLTTPPDRGASATVTGAVASERSGASPAVASDGPDKSPGVDSARGEIEHDSSVRPSPGTPPTPETTEEVDEDLVGAPTVAPTTPLEDLRTALKTVPEGPGATVEQREARAEILALIAEFESQPPVAEPDVRSESDETVNWSRDRVIAAIEGKASLAGANLSDLDLSSIDFGGANLQEACFRGARLDGAILAGCNLQRADLSGASAEAARFEEADLRFAHLSAAQLRSAVLSGAECAGADLRGADLSGGILEEARFDGANLDGAVLVGARAAGATFVEARLEGVNATEADLSGASFQLAALGGAVFVRADLRGANFEKAVAPRVDMTGADLAEAELLGADLTEGIFRWIRGERSQWIACGLTKADFFEADLDEADFSKATMVACNFTAVSFRHGILRRANLERAILVRADLFEALLPAARLVATDLRGANLWAVDLADAEMAQLEIAGANIGRTRLEA